MESFVISIGDKSFSVPRTMIANLQVNKEFEDMIYPLYYVSINIPLWVYELMVKSPRDIHVSMHLQYTLVDDVEKALIGNCRFATEIKGSFLGWIPNVTQIADASHQDAIAKSSGSYNKSYEYNEGAIIEMALYNEAAYKASFNMINAVLSNVTLNDAMGYVLNANNIKNVIMDKSDSNRNYPEFLVLPQSGIKNILRITDEFKFHSDGSIVFFDLIDSYIIGKKIGCRVWKNNEHRCVYIISQSAFSDTMENFSGVHIDNDQKFTVLSVKEDAFQILTPDSSPLLRSQPNMEFLTINTANALLNLLTPNKEFQFTIDDNASNKYNGKYRIRSMNMNCSPRGEFLNPIFSAVFRK